LGSWHETNQKRESNPRSIDANVWACPFPENKAPVDNTKMKIQKPWVIELNGITAEKRAAVEVMGRMLGNKYDCIREFRCTHCNEEMEWFGTIGTYDKPFCGECHSKDDVQFVRMRKL
jgi:hypothetical protein